MERRRRNWILNTFVLEFLQSETKEMKIPDVEVRFYTFNFLRRAKKKIGLQLQDI